MVRGIWYRPFTELRKDQVIVQQMCNTRKVFLIHIRSYIWWTISQQAGDADPLLEWYWVSVADNGTTSCQQWVNASCSLGYLHGNLRSNDVIWLVDLNHYSTKDKISLRCTSLLYVWCTINTVNMRVIAHCNITEWLLHRSWLLFSNAIFHNKLSYPRTRSAIPCFLEHIQSNYFK